MSNASESKPGRKHDIRYQVNIESKLMADAYDRFGRLLLRAGETIQRECEKEWLDRPDIWFGETPTPSNQTAIQNQPEEPPKPINPIENFKIRQEYAKNLKKEATHAIVSVFNRIVAREHVDANEVRQTVKPLIKDISKDYRALLSLVNLKDVDAYTFTHCVNVAILAIMLATRSGYSHLAEEIGIGAILHDLGKITTPSSILNKAGPLTEQEMKIMRQHPKMGAALLIKSGGYSDISIHCVLDHHESLDGNGYPNGKMASELTPPAMITSIADIYDALTTNRPYRKALTPREALSMMTQKMASALEPQLLRIFVSLIGHFPVGSKIKLTNGYEAIVLANSPDNPNQPGIVQLTADPSGQAIKEPIVVDLRRQNDIKVDCPEASTPTKDVTKIVMREMRGFDAVA